MVPTLNMFWYRQLSMHISQVENAVLDLFFLIMNIEVLKENSCSHNAQLVKRQRILGCDNVNYLLK